MGCVETRLEELGIVLPAAMEPPGNFKLVDLYGGLAYVAGEATSPDFPLAIPSDINRLRAIASLTPPDRSN